VEEEAEEEEAAEPSVNEILLMEGLARVEKYAMKKPQCKPFVEAQEMARKVGHTPHPPSWLHPPPWPYTRFLTACALCISVLHTLAASSALA